MSDLELCQKITNALKKLVQSQMGRPSERAKRSAAAALESLLLSSTNLEDVRRNWRRIVGEFRWSSVVKTNRALRDQLLLYVTQIGYVLPDEDLGSFIDHLATIVGKSRREDERRFYIEAIAGTIRRFCDDATPLGRRLTVEHITTVMDVVKTCLDESDSPATLTPLLDICQDVARWHSTEFLPHLRDVCDFVIGWYMDRNQPDYVEVKCHEMICVFRPFFRADIAAAVGFLISLVDDLLFTVQQLANEEEQKKRYFIYSNIVSILIVFDDIWENSFTVDNLPAASELAEKLNANLEAVVTTIKKRDGRLAGVAALHLALAVLRVSKVSATVSDTDTVRRLLRRAYACPVASQRDISVVLRLSEKIMSNSNELIDREEMLRLFVDFYTSDDCVLLMSTELSVEASAAMSKMLSTAKLGAIQPKYRHVTDKLQSEFQRLAVSLENGQDIQSARQRELTLCSLLSALEPLIVAKNSIIVLRGLNPSLFALLFQLLPLQERWLAAYFPSVFQRLLALAKRFAETHNQFIANSDLLSTAAGRTSSFLIESPAAKYFEHILSTVGRLLDVVGAADDAGEMSLIDWLDAMTQAVSADVARFLPLAADDGARNDAMVTFQEALLTVFVEQRLTKKSNGYKTLLTAIHRFGVFSALDDPEFGRVIVGRLAEKADDSVCEQFLKLINHLPVAYFMSESFAECLNNAKLYTQSPLGKSSMGAFYFQLLTNFLADGQWTFSAKRKDNHIDNELIDRLHTDLVGGQLAEPRLTTDRKLSAIAQHYALFCVENRLRTPIGKAVDTFSKFDGVINQLAVEIANETTTELAVSAATSPHNIRRVTFALDMLDALDKLMNLAHRGSGLAAAHQFFYTNESSWQAWLLRVTPPAMSLCFAIGRYAQIVRLAGGLFADVEKRYAASNRVLRPDSITLSAICWLVRAYVELAAPLAVRGVRRWIYHVFQIDMPWIGCAEKLAESNYESSLSGFCKILDFVEQPPSGVTQAIRAMCVKAMKSCRNIAFTRPFYDQISRSLSRQPDDSPEDGPATDCLKLQLDSINSLASWTELRSTLPPLSNRRLVNLSAFVDQTEIALARAFASSSLESSREKAETKASSLEEDIAQLCSLALKEPRDDASAIAARATILRQSFNVMSAIDKRAKTASAGATSEKLIANSYAGLSALWSGVASTDVAVGQMVCDWLERVYAAGSGFYGAATAQATLRSTLVTAHAEMAHSAAKTGNAALSQLHMRKYSETLTAGTDTPLNERGFVSNGFAPARGIAGGQSTMVKTNVNLRTFLRTAKITWNLDLSGSDSSALVRSDCFRNMLNVVDAHSTIDAAAAKPSRRKLIGQMCVCLSRWAGELSNAMNIIYQVQSGAANHSTMQNVNMVIQLAEQLEADGISSGVSESLRGAFLLAASGSAALAAANVHYALADWVLSRTYDTVTPETSKDDSDISDEETKVLRVSPNESALLRRIGINAATVDGRRILALMGSCKTLDAFQLAVRTAFKLEDTSTLWNALFLSDFGQLWTLIKRRQFKLFDVALNASINFLVGADFTDAKSALKVVTTALRLIDSLDAQPEWFQKVIGPNWPTTISFAVWKNVIPQIFTLLSHADLFVRQTALRILSHIGEKRPHAVCYPTIVGMVQPIIGGSNERYVTGTTDDDLLATGLSVIGRSNAEQKRFHRRESCRRLIESLRVHSPQLVDNATEFGAEMRKIEMLREERWLFALQRLDGALARRAAEIDDEFVSQFTDAQLTDEQQRTAGVRQRHENVSAPIYEKLRRLFDVTCVQPAETDNDAKFIDTFRTQLEQALEHFDQNRHDINAAFAPFRNILSTITARAMKRSALALQTSDISPYLASLSQKSAVLPMPGQPFNATAVVTLHKTNDDVIILPTKTRPKKLTFIGSDGKTYAFLFKGHENLRVDERVMQLSKTCNTLLRTKAHHLLPITRRRMTGGADEFLLSTYSVTPLGDKCGLIEWVDGATPLFHLYRKWKLRDTEDQESRRQQQELKTKIILPDSPNLVRKVFTRSERVGAGRKSSPGGEAAKPRDVTRPTEQFFAKLKEVFIEEGVELDVLKSRQDWPRSCLEKVFAALVRETPRDILAKEFWMHAGNSSTFWRVTRRFARSTAAASLVGWTVLGLGDRHLDNVLVDVRTGRVVHVDYNVSFEKGLTLRVPETVPFRLTGNIVSALGPTGVEGMFRESAIQVLSLLRANREVILAMLKMSDETEVRDQIEKDPREKTPSEETDEAGTARRNATPPIGGYGDVDVVAAVRQKLNGRERIGWVPPAKNAMTSEEQVGFLIEKAINPINLALLYEGWTAWV